jgi:hypothetical protein
VKLESVPRLADTSVNVNVAVVSFTVNVMVVVPLETIVDGLALIDTVGPAVS